MTSIKIFLSCFLLLVCSNFLPGQDFLTSIIERYDEFNKEIEEASKTGWPNVSDSFIEKNILHHQSLIQALSKVNKAELNEEDQINVEMFKLILESALFDLEYGTHLMPLNSEGGFIISMMYNVRGKKLNSDEDIQNYIKKINSTNLYLDAQIANLRKGLKSEIIRPKIVVENCIQILEDLLSSDEFFLFVPLKGKHTFEPQFETEIFNAFRRLHTFLKNEYLPKARIKIGIKENKNGKAFYEQRVRFYTTLDMSPQEVFEVGKSEVARIRSEMEAIIDSVNFEGSFEEFTTFLREDPQFYAQTDKELLYFASWLSKKAEAFLPRYFNKLPRLPFTVTPVPLAIAPNYTTGRYSGGSMKGQKAGQYWVNTYNLPARPLYVLPSLTLHEAVPGHHLQISLAKELKGLPKFRSHYLSAFGEGWGLYSEYLGKEAGMYQTAYEDFGRLTYEMWRACRLVVDPGMHYFDMTKEEAIAFMKDNTALSMHEINTEINRYIGWPGQAVSYKIGELKIRELRKKAELELGDKFDIREFHDLVLANGSIPLNTLERIINQYIEIKNSDVEKN